MGGRERESIDSSDSFWLFDQISVNALDTCSLSGGLAGRPRDVSCSCQASGVIFVSFTRGAGRLHEGLRCLALDDSAG